MVRLGSAYRTDGEWGLIGVFPSRCLMIRWTPLNQKRPLSRRSLVAFLGHMKYMVPRARLSLFVVPSNGLVTLFLSLVSSVPRSPHLFDDP